MGEDRRTVMFGKAGMVAGAVGDWLRLQRLLWSRGVRPEQWNAAGRDGVEGPRRQGAGA